LAAGQHRAKNLLTGTIFADIETSNAEWLTTDSKVSGYTKNNVTLNNAVIDGFIGDMNQQKLSAVAAAAAGGTYFSAGIYSQPSKWNPITGNRRLPIGIGDSYWGCYYDGTDFDSPPSAISTSTKLSIQGVKPTIWQYHGDPDGDIATSLP